MIIDVDSTEPILINEDLLNTYEIKNTIDNFDLQINEYVSENINIIQKTIDFYEEQRRAREEKQVKETELVLQIMILVGQLDFKKDVNAKKILVKYWPSKVNMPKKLNINKVQQLAGIIATELIVKEKTVEDFISDNNLNPKLLDELKFDETDFNNVEKIKGEEPSKEIISSLNDTNKELDEMKKNLQDKATPNSEEAEEVIEIKTEGVV
jgi:hypothetical protein